MFKDKLVFKLGCAKHPRYSPLRDFVGGVKGGCQTCILLCEINDLAKAIRNKVLQVNKRNEEHEQTK